MSIEHFDIILCGQLDYGLWKIILYLLSKTDSPYAQIGGH